MSTFDFDFIFTDLTSLKTEVTCITIQEVIYSNLDKICLLNEPRYIIIKRTFIPVLAKSGYTVSGAKNKTLDTVHNSWMNKYFNSKQ